MRVFRHLLATVAMLFAVSHASAADSAAVIIGSTVAPNCQFTETPAPVTNIGSTPGVYTVGTLAYTCNFAGSANLVLNLPNGTVLHNPSSGGDNVLYDIFWGVPPNNPASPVWQSWATPQSIPFAWPTAPLANTATGGPILVRLQNPLTVAGTYSSTISYTLSP